MPMEFILILVVMGLFYFMAIRPAQKKMAAQMTMQNSLEPGQRVVLTSGLYATLHHVGERQVVAELAPGVEVTLTKSAVAQLVKPEDEEFEFTDDEVAEQPLEASPVEVETPLDDADAAASPRDTRGL